MRPQSTGVLRFTPPALVILGLILMILASLALTTGTVALAPTSQSQARLLGQVQLHPPEPFPDAYGPYHPTIELFRSWNEAAVDHFYTISGAEVQAAEVHGYVFEGVATRMYAEEGIDQHGLDFHRMWHPVGEDHFYTTSIDELLSAAGFGYQYEGVSGFCDGAQLFGVTTAFYRLYHGDGVDHFYTINPEEALNATNGGWAFEGIACYTIPV